MSSGRSGSSSKMKMIHSRKKGEKNGNERLSKLLRNEI
jgi:hypothetical protein